MISAEQIKAARAMLDLTQDDLADACGLSANTICSLESGNISSRSSILVRKTLEGMGFEFHGHNGLSRRSDEARVYSGPHGSDHFYDDILAVAESQSVELLAIFWSQQSFMGSLGLPMASASPRLKYLGQRIKIKCLLVDVPHLVCDVPGIEFRGMTHYRGINRFPALIYGNRTAIVSTLRSGSEYIYFLMHSADTAREGVKEFMPLWAAAYPLVAKPSI